MALRGLTGPAPQARTSTLRGPQQASPAVPTQANAAGAPDSGSDFPIGSAIAGGAALAGAGLLARSPAVKAAAPMVARGLEYANALRQQLMLSGFAPLKSVLGNIGAAVAQSAESRSLLPLKELLSMQTLDDALPAGATLGEKLKDAFITGKSAVAPNAAGGVNLPGVLGGPGRLMNSLDQATQKALQRAGLSIEDAERSVFQTPLGGPLAKGFKDNPVADYLFPFRRTPINQFTEGLSAIKGETLIGKKDPLVAAGYATAGAAHGAATKDDRYPLSIPLGIAASARYGLPYGIAAIAGRLLAGGKGPGNTAGSVLPVSEYGLSQSIEEPLAPYQEPAALRALKALQK